MSVDGCFPNEKAVLTAVLCHIPKDNEDTSEELFYQNETYAAVN